jgi:hypothetical protein
MLPRQRSLKLISTLVASVVFLCESLSLAQSPRTTQRPSFAKFDWNCASTSTYPRATLVRVIERALKTEEYSEGPPDRAFPFDLDRDGKPEYFVPLWCGAVGNCTWAVVALSPTRLLGKVNGQYLFVQRQAKHWPTIFAYGHLSAMEGVLDTYVFAREHYRVSGKGLPIGPAHRMLEVQKARGHTLPKSLDNARGACKDLGH